MNSKLDLHLHKDRLDKGLKFLGLSSSLDFPHKNLEKDLALIKEEFPSEGLFYLRPTYLKRTDESFVYFIVIRLEIPHPMTNLEHRLNCISQTKDRSVLDSEVKLSQYAETEFLKRVNPKADEILFFDHMARLQDSCTSNVVGFAKNKIIVPIISSGENFFQGITVKELINFCEKNNREIVFKEIFYEELEFFDSLVLLNQVRGARFIHRLDEIEFKNLESDLLFIKSFINESWKCGDLNE